MTWPQPISGEGLVFHMVMFGPSLLLETQELLLSWSTHMVQAGSINFGTPFPLIKGVSQHVTKPGQSEFS